MPTAQTAVGITYSFLSPMITALRPRSNLFGLTSRWGSPYQRI